VSPSVLESVAREQERAIDVSAARAFRSLLRHAPAPRAAHARELSETFTSPLAALLGYASRGTRACVNGAFVETLETGRQIVAAFVTVSGAEPLRAARALLIRVAGQLGVRWCLATNGTELALVDCGRSHARRWLSFDLKGCAADVRSMQALVAVVGATALRREDNGPSPLELLIARTETDLRAIRTALQGGVEQAAMILTAALDRRDRSRATPIDALFEQALTVVYRILFLQFAESRGLVPVWHPTYRRGYTIAALREAITEGRGRGTWEALQAIARLANKGATAGDLSVVAFNGRLFSPAHSPLVAGASIPDGTAMQVIDALTSREEPRRGRIAIAYSDLGVEQLGSIYERVLELSPERDRRSGMPLLRRGDLRKSTGSFYTPRSLTEFIVRRTLEPLTREATPEQVLALKVLDPAMGSGAFLVAACRELARAYEEALIRDGVAGAGDWSARDRAGFRRLVAQKCLYGVDLNAMAVQLARLSLWLCSLAADKPLTFLDHRLRVGNSVLGTSPHHVMSRAPGSSPRGKPTLFSDDVMEIVGRAIEVRQAIGRIPDDSVAQVHHKEALLAQLESDDSSWRRWKAICDLWCACWFWADGQEAPGRSEFGAMCDVLREETALAPPALRARLALAARIALNRRFFHWELEFPEVFASDGFQGFDAIVGNPPWDMVRGRRELRQSLRFTRDSGTFRLQSSGHGNLYQLFLERALRLARPGGRVGIVLPWGVATDHGSGELRRHLLDRCTVDELVVLDNRRGIFPIHRALKFCALFLDNSGNTDRFQYRPAIAETRDLEREDETIQAAPRVEFSRALLEAVSGSSLAIPYVDSPVHVRVIEQLIASAFAAADRRGWGLHFGRELNASDDRVLFSEGGRGFPVISGRHIGPFTVNAEASSLRIREREARDRLGPAVDRYRLAYRDVSGSGNRVTLIAALIPPQVVTTHTLFCLKNRLSHDEQLFLAAVLNSYVANYLVRTRVGTHVTTALVHTLPIPRPPSGSTSFQAIVSLARRGESPQLQAAVAAPYGLDPPMFETILGTFPLVPSVERDAAAAALGALSAI
jgi:hypothetical protein